MKVVDDFLAKFGFSTHQIKYSKNTVWLFAEQGYRMLSMAVVGIIITRYLGRQNMGLYGAALSFASLFGPIASLGLNNLLVRDLVKFPDQRDALLGTSFWLRIISGSITLIVVLGYAFYKYEGAYLWIIVFSMIGTYLQAFGVIEAFFQSNVTSRRYVYVQLTSVTVSAIIKLSLVYYHCTVQWFAITLIAEALIYSSGLLIFYGRSGLNIRNWHYNKEWAKLYLRSCIPVIMSTLFVILYMKIDQVLVLKMLGADASGNYYGAVKLSELFYFIPVLICSSLMPAIVNGKAISEKVYEERLRKLFSLLVWMAIGIATVIFFASDLLVNIFCGKDFPESAHILRVHIWSLVFVFTGTAAGTFIINENLLRFYTINTFVGLVVNITLNIVFFPIYGVIVAAYSTVIAYAVTGFLNFAMYSRTRFVFRLLVQSLYKRWW